MSDITFDVTGRAGVITLNRPKALNALSVEMIEAMGEALTEWAADDRVARVAVRGEGRAFCAGGDIRDIYERRTGAIDFFAAEYRNNCRVAEFPKPYVALIDGVVMGGGVGISMHGSHRLGGEGTLFAMPEVGIGLVPDVGATHLLSNLSRQQGTMLALTGKRLQRDEAAALGLLTHPLTSGRLEDALDRIAHARSLDDALDDLVVETEPADEEERALVEEAFSAETVEEILERLGAAAGRHEAAGEMAATIGRMSPTSLKLALEAQRRHGAGDVRDALRTEFRMVSEILENHDLYEGIRATVIDKDKAPKWSPSTLAGVDRDALEAHFAEPPHGDLDFPQRPTGVAA